MGFRNPQLASVARERGAVTVSWTLRALDGVPTTARRIVDRVTRRARPGDIIMLHDGREPGRRRDPRPTIDALPVLIRNLRDRGLEPVRLDQLIGEPAYRPAARDASDRHDLAMKTPRG
jgi:peptidoglycan/xylan/chitin deacetylase (PgdA/CDA1 family)